MSPDPPSPYGSLSGFPPSVMKRTVVGWVGNVISVQTVEEKSRRSQFSYTGPLPGSGLGLRRKSFRYGVPHPHPSSPDVFLPVVPPVVLLPPVSEKKCRADDHDSDEWKENLCPREVPVHLLRVEMVYGRPFGTRQWIREDKRVDIFGFMDRISRNTSNLL